MLSASRLLRAAMARLPVHFSSTMDSGNGKLVKLTETGADAWQVDFELEPEPFTESTDKRSHLQWFHFRLSNIAGRTVRCRMVNAADSSYPVGWEGYKTAATYDGDRWFRCQQTQYVDGVVDWTLRVPEEHDTVWFGYWATYTWDRHQKLISMCAESPLAKVSVLGSTCDGRTMDMVTFGNGRRNVWVVARQHPGESMAEWTAEGFLKRMTDPDDALARHLRSVATVRVVPNMNPDGSVRGHLRTNAKGCNLNREWAPLPDGSYQAPTVERSPEVFYVLREMDRVGCDLFIDMHGDELIEANFFVSSGDCANWSPRLASLHQQLSNALLRANPDFQLELGYQKPTPEAKLDPPVPGTARLNIGSLQIAHRFDCLSVTLEQPFKDCRHNTPEPECQWSPQRASLMGRTLVDAISDVVPDLRGAPAKL